MCERHSAGIGRPTGGERPMAHFSREHARVHISRARTGEPVQARLSGEWGEGVRLEARPESRRATVVFNLRAGGGF